MISIGLAFIPKTGGTFVLIPNFLVVGAARAGVSLLDRFLIQHPDIFLPDRREASFFSTPDFPFLFKGPGDEGMNTDVIRTWDQYEMLFEEVYQKRAIGESSGYYLYYPGTAERIHQARHTMKIIIMLRNPVDRAFSAYTYLRRENRETFTFERALKEEKRRKQADYSPIWFYREVGLYYEQVKRYLDIFGKDQVKILLYDHFINDLQNSIVEILEFLDLYKDIPIDPSLLLNVTGVPTSRKAFDFFAKPHILKELVKPFIPPNARQRLGHKAKNLFLEAIKMNPKTRADLTAFYRPNLKNLQILINQDLSAWMRP